MTDGTPSLTVAEARRILSPDLQLSDEEVEQLIRETYAFARLALRAEQDQLVHLRDSGI